MFIPRQNTRTPTLPLKASVKSALKTPLGTDRAWIPFITSRFEGIAPITGF